MIPLPSLVALAGRDKLAYEAFTRISQMGMSAKDVAALIALGRFLAADGSQPTYATNAAAIAGGLVAGQFFKVNTAGEYSVHVVV